MVAQEERVEIVIRNYEFRLTQPAPVRLHQPTIIVLRNQDIVRHGFASPMLQHVMVHGESEGVAAYGKGGGGFYLDPGKTPVIRFVPERPGKYSFPCDLHQTMTGELKVLFNILNKRPPSCGPPDLPTSRNPSGQPSSRTSAWLSRASLGSTPNSGGAYGHLRGGAP
ncbi:MAG TPA: hypothetical protein VGA17_12135, partial [Nitrospiraceae bacterium]